MSCAGLTRAAGALRRRMPRRLFFVPPFLLLFLACCACGPACAGRTAQPVDRAELFAPRRTKVLRGGAGGNVTVKDVKHFRSPIFVSANGVMVALAEAQYTGYTKPKIEVAARYVGTEDEDWLAGVNANNLSNWAIKFTTPVEEEGYSYVSRKPMAVARGNKIYFVVVNHKTEEGRSSLMDRDWDIGLTVADVAMDTQGAKSTHWQTYESSRFSLTRQLKIHSLYVLPRTGFAFLTQDEKAVFVVQAVKAYKRGFIIFHLKDTGNETEFVWSIAEVAKNCEFSFFPWERKVIMLSTGCRDGRHYVRESADLGKTWRDAVGPISRLWKHLQGKRDFTTVTIGKRTALLFTQRREGVMGTGPRHEVRLWVSDGNRVHDAGPIVTDTNRVGSSGLMYANGELLSLYQQWKKGSSRILLTRLHHQTESIKFVLGTWAKNDAYLSRPCNETVRRGAPPGTLCLTPVPTDGLVGLLSDRGSADLWQDEYLFANATVRGGTKVPDGFWFNGTGAGAKWPMFGRRQSERYDFAGHGLTVSATVTIHGAPGADGPLLTVDGVGGEERLGLWHSRDKRWRVMPEHDSGAAHACGWQVNKTYRVALTINNTDVCAYVDGQFQGSLRIPALWKGGYDIQHVFIAGYEDNNVRGTVSHVTVTNVFLYNRPLNATELEALKGTVATLKPTNLEENVTKSVDPKKELTRSVDPKKELTKSVDPKKELTKSVDPKKELTRSVDPKKELTKSVDPKKELTKSVDPKKDVTKSVDLKKDVTKSTVSDKRPVHVRRGWETRIRPLPGIWGI